MRWWRVTLYVATDPFSLSTIQPPPPLAYRVEATSALAALILAAGRIPGREVYRVEVVQDTAIEVRAG